MISEGIEKYVFQLMEDLLEAAKNPPMAPYIEPPTHLEPNPVISELALVPFRTIEEWSGIRQERFPECYEMPAGQCACLNVAILKLFDSLNLTLIDIPPDIPPEILYEVFIRNWDLPVQYLTSSGADIEFCTGDPEDCLYGEYCKCHPSDK